MGENLNTAEIEKYIFTEQTMKKGILLVAHKVFERVHLKKILNVKYFNSDIKLRNVLLEKKYPNTKFTYTLYGNSSSITLKIEDTH